jgi:hypothetical protein
VHTVMNLCVPQNEGNFFTSYGTISFSKEACSIESSSYWEGLCFESQIPDLRLPRFSPVLPGKFWDSTLRHLKTKCWFCVTNNNKYTFVICIPTGMSCIKNHYFPKQLGFYNSPELCSL